MKKALFYLLFIAFAFSVKAQKIDTIYYDSNWKGVPVKELASYIRVIYYAPIGSGYNNIGKDYFITGELQSEGSFTYIDKFDDSKSKWKGKYTRYFKSGKKEAEGFNNDSSLSEGEQIQYYENGTMKVLYVYSKGELQTRSDFYESGKIQAKCSFLNGKMNGNFLKYWDDGSGYMEVEMVDDAPKNDYVTYVDKEGNRTRYNKDTNKLIQDEPQSKDLKSTKINEQFVQFYQMNGILLMANMSIESVYGKYFVMNLHIENNSNEKFDFDASQIKSFVEKGTKTIYCDALTSDEYAGIVNRKQKVSSFFNALGEGMAAYNAGTTTASSSNTSAGYVNATAYGSDNSGNVAIAGGSAYGTSQSSSQTNIRNGAAQYLSLIHI